MDTRSSRQSIAALAARQFGIVSRAQALERGFSRTQIQTRLDTGDWLVMRPGVYRFAAAPLTADSRAIAALLHAPPGSALSHLTAARLLDLGVRSRSRATWISIPHGNKRAPGPGIRFVRSRTLDGFVTVMRGWRITTPARTIVDLASLLPQDRLSAVAYDAVRTRLVSVEEIARAAAVVSPRRHAPRLRAMLGEFDASFESGLEADADAVFRAAGFFFEPQYEVYSGGRFIARVDFADLERKLAIEIDGARYHSSAEAQERDRKRDRRLIAAGWHPIHFTTDDVRHHPETMVAQLREILAGRAA